jgi:hypothetical protein
VPIISASQIMLSNFSISAIALPNVSIMSCDKLGEASLKKEAYDGESTRQPPSIPITQASMYIDVYRSKVQVTGSSNPLEDIIIKDCAGRCLSSKAEGCRAGHSRPGQE